MIPRKLHLLSPPRFTTLPTGVHTLRTGGIQEGEVEPNERGDAYNTLLIERTSETLAQDMPDLSAPIVILGG